MSNFKVCVLVNPDSVDTKETTQYAKNLLNAANEDGKRFDFFNLSPEINMNDFVEFISEHDKAETIKAVITPKGEWIDATEENTWETELNDILANNNLALVFVADCSK